jgi:hypothetical protein
MDPSTDLAKKLNNAVIDTLYNTIAHPPASFLGPEHVFRHADGGGNNLLQPNIGRGGTPYARSVQGKAGLPSSSLPDPSLVFDTILKKSDVSVLHCLLCSIFLLSDRLEPKTLWRNVVNDIRFCIHRYAFAFPNRSQ